MSTNTQKGDVKVKNKALKYVCVTAAMKDGCGALGGGAYRSADASADLLLLQPVASEQGWEQCRSIWICGILPILENLSFSKQVKEHKMLSFIFIIEKTETFENFMLLVPKVSACPPPTAGRGFGQNVNVGQIWYNLAPDFLSQLYSDVWKTWSDRT